MPRNVLLVLPFSVHAFILFLFKIHFNSLVSSQHCSIRAANDVLSFVTECWRMN